MRLAEIYPQIKSHPIFKNSDAMAIDKYITEADIRQEKYASGDDICSPCTQNDSIGVMLSGTATVSSKDEDKSVLLRTMGEGAMFGIANLYAENAVFPTRISARSACEVLFIKKDAIRSLIENDTSTLKSFLAFQSNKIVYLNKKINAFTAGSAERRLSLFLADNETDGVCSLDISMSALADMLDIGRASLYRALDSLIEDGFIERADKAMIIKDKKSMLEKHFS